jgi:hypothetical protein
MSAYNKFNSFVEALAEKVHNLGSDTLKIALTNTAPVAGNTQLSNITEISYTNCSSRVPTTLSSSQTAGVYSLVLQDLILTATGRHGRAVPLRRRLQRHRDQRRAHRLVRLRLRDHAWPMARRSRSTSARTCSRYS